MASIFSKEFWLGDTIAAETPVELKDEPVSAAPAASGIGGGEGFYMGNSVAVFSKSFDGEKTPGSLGAPVNLVPDYRSMAIRAHKANLDNDVVKIITGKKFQWVCGSGLKLQAEPSDVLLKLEKCISEEETLSNFAANVEAYWSLFADSNTSDYAGMCNLHDNSWDAYATSYLSGDVLWVCRFDDKFDLTVQVVDGQHIRQPMNQRQFFIDAEAAGNTIRNGIEKDAKGTHIAYYVLKQSKKNPMGEYERVEARGKNSGMEMAWLEYGDKARIDHDRGITKLASVLEKVAKLDRYTEATVSSAEERSKIVLQIVHNQFSTGENPFEKIKVGGRSAVDPYTAGQGIARSVAVTEEKDTYNMPVGSEMKSISSQAEVQYETFFKAIFVQICAGMDIPPEVALQQYNSNYSASRAAINGWGYMVDIARQKHANNSYKKVYALWLHAHILKNKVQAPGYLKAVNENNVIVMESYRKARFTGSNMPHIDPLKEANAIRVMLGDLTTPLITLEHATELLGAGSWAENVKKIDEERKRVPELLPGQLKNPPLDQESEPDEDDETDDETPPKPSKKAA